MVSKGLGMVSGGLEMAPDELGTVFEPCGMVPERLGMTSDPSEMGFDSLGMILECSEMIPEHAEMTSARLGMIPEPCGSAPK
jgi:hypothetical protein